MTHVPLVIHFLVPVVLQVSWAYVEQQTKSLPLIIHSLPSSLFVAVVCSPITSLPAWASDIAKHMNFLPSSTSGTTLAFSSSLPKLRTGGSPMTLPPRSPEHYRKEK